MRFSTAQSKSILALILLLATFVLVADDVAAQQQRSRRRSRRRPAPQVVVPQQPANAQAPRDAEVVGTAENLAGQGSEGPATTGTAANGAGASPSSGTGGTEALLRTIEKLSSQISELTRKINRLEDRNSAPDYERLSRAEQRAEALHTQLTQIQEKELNLRVRSDQLDYEMRPENLMRRTELIGSINPGAMREQFRQQLEREKQVIGTQLEQLAASRARLEPAIASADSYVERLRKRVDADDDELGEGEAATSKAQRAPAQPPPDGAP